MLNYLSLVERITCPRKFCPCRKGDLLPHTHFNCEIAVTVTREWFLENQFFCAQGLKERKKESWSSRMLVVSVRKKSGVECL